MSAKVAALVLAAGQGTRFGPAFKLMAMLEGKPLVRHAVEAALASSACPVFVVVGHREPEVRAALAGLDVVFVANAAYRSGLSTSLRAGFAATAEAAAKTQAATGLVVLLGDMPRVSSALIDGLIAAWDAAGRPAAALPVLDGRRGNPVLLSTRLAPEIAGLEGDAGAGPLLRQRTDVLEWPTRDTAVLFDVDVPEALASARPQP